MDTPIYLDYAATTPMAPEVVEAMLPCLTDAGVFANPSSNQHSFGADAASAMEKARSQIAAVFQGGSKDFIFTSGATEANNLAIKGTALTRQNARRHIITSAIEHKSVLATCKHLETQGIGVTYIRPDSKGMLAVDEVLNVVTDETILVSIMHVNNETGVIQPVAEIARALEDKDLLFHVDAAQSAGKMAIDLNLTPIDLLPLSAHKFHGPKGVGCLYIRNRSKNRLTPLLHGGGQEFGLRPGTSPTHQIVGMASALQLAQQNMTRDAEHCQRLKRSLLDVLMPLGGITLNGEQSETLPNIVNLGFDQVSADSLLITLRDNVAIASGSACNSGAVEASHVLRAMGIEGDRLYGAVRISFGRYTTETEIRTAGHRIAEQVLRLRELASA